MSALSPEHIEQLTDLKAQLENAQILPFPEQPSAQDEVTGPQVTVRTRPMSREQGPPDQQTVDPVMAAPTESDVVLPDSAKPVVSTRIRGGAQRPEGPVAVQPKPHKKPKSRGELTLDDLVTVDGLGRGHRPNGTVLSNYERDQILAHETQIRRGLGELAAERGLVELDSKGRVHRENGQLMSNKELAQLAGASKYERLADEPDTDFEDTLAVTDEFVDHVLTSSEDSEQQPAATISPDEATSGVREPVTELSDPSLRQRLKRIWAKGRDALLKTYINVENRMVAPRKHQELTETQLQHRRWALNAGIGALVVYRVWAMQNGLHTGNAAPTGHSNDLANLLMHGQGGQSNHDVSGLTGHGVGREHGVTNGLTGHGHSGYDQHQGDLTGNEMHGGQRLKEGHTIWNDLADRAAERGHHLSEAQLNYLVGQTLHANNLSWDDARHLPAGFHYSVPPQVIDALTHLDD